VVRKSLLSREGIREVPKLTKKEKKIILNCLYDRFVSLGDEYNSRDTAKNDKPNILDERLTLAKLINKLEGAQAINLEKDI
jgi:hypothetical protein